MKTRMIVLAAVLAAVAMGGYALSPEHVEFGKGPAQFLMTKDEIAKWKAIKTDEEAAAFIALFWARRDPTPATPQNELRQQFDMKVEYANKNFDERSGKGALTDRGKMLILFGLPKRLELSGAAKPEAVLTPGGVLNPMPSTDSRPDRESINWIYEGEESTLMFQTPRAKISFVDRFNNRDFKMERGAVDVAAAQQRAIERFITQPDLKAPPSFAAPVAAAAAPAAVAAAPVVTALTTDALKTAVSEFKAAAKSPYENRKIYVTWGEYITADDETFAPVQVYVPSSLGMTAAQSLTFFGVVEDASGNPVLAFEEPAKLMASKSDYYIDKSLALPAGKQRGIFGIAENGKVISMVSADMELTGKIDKSVAAVSQLILSNNIFPLPEAQKPNDPYAFGGVKVVPKSDRTFRQTDELWYFFELRNPGLADAAPAAPAADGTAPPPAAQAPKIQVKMEVQGKEFSGKPVKRGSPPREVAAIPMKGVPGHYGMGSAIPLSSFEPGEYTFNVKVIDTVTKTSYNLSEPFKVVP